MPGPLPRWLTGCSYPFLPLSHRPSPKVHWVGCTTIIRSTTSERVGITRLQSFDNLQASEFAATQVVPTAGNRHGCQGGRGVYIRAERGSLSPRASDILAVRNRAIDGRGLSPPRSAALLAAPDFTTTMPAFKFSVQTPPGSNTVPRDKGECALVRHLRCARLAGKTLRGTLLERVV